jgi:hypothetical protein
MTLHDVERTVAALNDAGFSCIGESFVSFSGTESTYAIELSGKVLWDDHDTDLPEECPNPAEELRVRIVDYAKRLLAAYDTPLSLEIPEADDVSSH